MRDEYLQAWHDLCLEYGRPTAPERVAAERSWDRYSHDIVHIPGAQIDQAMRRIGDEYDPAHRPTLADFNRALRRNRGRPPDAQPDSHGVSADPRRNGTVAPDSRQPGWILNSDGDIDIELTNEWRRATGRGPTVTQDELL